jgi:pimeloyl-ACP methyl ester carboxylesterase
MNAISTQKVTPSRLVPPSNLGRPPLLKTLSELRALAEIGGLMISRGALQKHADKGDGHPVLIIPGFMSGDTITRSMRRFLQQLGYDPHPWEQGTNLGLRDEVCLGIEQKIKALHKATGKKVSLIGHSLGGVYVRVVAHRQAKHVRQIITLGTPFNAAFKKQDADGKGGALARAYERLNADAATDELPNSKLMSFPPPVPSTSVYSESDGIIGWEHCLDIAGDLTENIRVQGSHTGMTHNPLVLHVIADRLAQAEHDWRRFRPSGLLGKLFKTACVTEAFPHWERDNGINGSESVE